MKKFLLATCEAVLLSLLVLSALSISNKSKPLNEFQHYFTVAVCVVRSFLKYELVS